MSSSTEVAAMLGQVGFVSLAPATLDKLQEGRALAPEEQQALERVPALAEQLIAGIPRLDAVRAALAHQAAPFDGAGAPAKAPCGKDIPLGARILAIVSDFDRLDTGGLSPELALAAMRGRLGRYDAELLELFASTLDSDGRGVEVAEIPIRLVRVGMTFVEDVRTPTGLLLVARGHEATRSLVERFRNLASGSVREPVRVLLRRSRTACERSHAGQRPVAPARILVVDDGPA